MPETGSGFGHVLCHDGGCWSGRQLHDTSLGTCRLIKRGNSQLKGLCFTTLWHFKRILPDLLCGRRPSDRLCTRHLWVLLKTARHSSEPRVLYWSRGLWGKEATDRRRSDPRHGHTATSTRVQPSHTHFGCWLHSWLPSEQDDIEYLHEISSQWILM